MCWKSLTPNLNIHEKYSIINLILNMVVVRLREIDDLQNVLETQGRTFSQMLSDPTSSSLASALGCFSLNFRKLP